ncbi:CDP-alcohol phosphatidyltransferase family protein [Rahnella woolbedingensis]|uniref:CDP-alcohol phosphatidyltransferase family protein n=1 Tax=Rahnella woolbedingensis TaxID=1510574 RepID=A0A419NAP2_9GAMM|nr:CDP-alcohol phosphatidyltransferase family protein [Rahnella woolbedingensis]RJT45080.1 CDP-alcohol phosphatidyltransferase family protein [Rahnella woolbedingensis]
MTLYDIKPQFQNLLRPLVLKLHQRGVTPNQVTLTALAMSVIAGVLLSAFPCPLLFLSLGVFLTVRMALNALDGMLAREFNQQTRTGAILNEVGDILSDVSLYLPFAFLPDVSLWWVILVLFLSCLTEFCAVVSQTLTGQRGNGGPLGKSDRALLFGTTGLGIALWPQYLFIINIVFIIAAPLLVWTCINRCRGAMVAKNV